MNKTYIIFRKGFTLIEILIVIAILAVLGTIVLSVLSNFNHEEALSKSAEAVSEQLRQARNQTIASQNAEQYGVHFTSTSSTLFAGGSYNSSDPNNVTYALSTPITLSVALTGGGNDIIFQRLTGETNQSGTLTLHSSSKTITVTIYGTGVVAY